jgi:hypothetical protein
MELIYHNGNDVCVAELISDNIEIKEMQDALDLMADAGYRGAAGIIINEKNLCPEFFDLSTQIAGDILQKFSNYNMKLAIIGDFTKYKSKSLHDFIFESNKTGRIFFVNSLSEAKIKLKIVL